MTRRLSPFSLFFSGVVLLFLLGPAISCIGGRLPRWRSILRCGRRFRRLSHGLAVAVMALAGALRGVFALCLVLGVPIGFGLARGPQVVAVLGGALVCRGDFDSSGSGGGAVRFARAVGGGARRWFVGTICCRCCRFRGATFRWSRGDGDCDSQRSPEEEEAALLGFGGGAGVVGRVENARFAGRVWGAFGAAALALWEMGAPDLLGWPTFSMHVYRNLAATDASVGAVSSCQPS